MVKALLASVFFSASIPISKMLLREVDPTVLAAMLYLGGGVGLLLYRAISNAVIPHGEAHLAAGDLPWLIGAILTGGVVAPIVLMVSLRITTAATASILLNFEGAATSIVAAILFREALGKRIWIAIILITFASVILSGDSHSGLNISMGALGILAACTLWGLDNNFTRNISGKDPVAITSIKGIAAGIFVLFVAIVLGKHFPSIKYMSIAVVSGFFAYGLSIVFFVSALRDLGAARTSAYFGTSPFIGAALSLILFKEIPSLSFFAAVPIMTIGAILLLRERHEHTHIHEEIEHEHRHTHDEHHCHKHEVISNGFHSYRHKHNAMTHKHPHTPDIHHRHKH